MTATSVAGAGQESQQSEGLQHNAVFLWLWFRNPSALKRMGEIYGGEGSPGE